MNEAPLVVIGIGLVWLSVVAMVVLHFIGRRVSPVERTMSEYAIVGWPQRIIFAISVLSISAAAVLLLILNLDHIVAVAALGFAASGMATTAFAVTDDLDPKSAEPQSSVHGAIHNVGALLAFFGTIVAAFSLTPFYTNLVGSFWVALIPLVGTVFFFVTFAIRERRARANRPSIHGIGERIALASVWVWLGLAFLSMV